MKVILAALGLLALGTFLRPIHVGAKMGDWVYAIDRMPAEIRISLAGMTDRRSEFSATCDVVPGRVSRLFIKAKKTAAGWDVIYEYGGIVSGHALVSIKQNGNYFVVSEPVYLKELKLN